MRGCDPSAAAAKLELAMETLSRARIEALSLWDDEMSRDFEAQNLAPLEPVLRRALDAIHHLAELLSKAERDCS
jgi:hypothetical protein